ncbi:hypothetical protein HAP41_0000009555 [Bradyrhizobium barranii subsp. apii]|uniref:Uncharacterized protein n=1 Tax=Bradyrhizobium barranii subsp. apii TaxID=2819348 RepID=A0A8T5VGW5_9BRAD|nr:aromatic-ring-hydroxylating dioxygenase subunit beta [Bradyrhizobium barranii]UPT89195.1 hypothetical protein HAP41_0000009555 [Bradyrhizobium barranii subsp. apii]
MGTSALKEEVQDFLLKEADLADEWALADWLALWADGEIAYEVGPLNMDQKPGLRYDQSLFLISDNRFRLEHRVLRIGKPDAHSESPIRSKIRHFYAHLRDVKEISGEITFRVNMLITRIRADQEGTNVIPGVVYFRLVREDSQLKIRSKQIFLDVQMLSSPGTLTYLA